jgi:hypothetical protein
MAEDERDPSAVPSGPAPDDEPDEPVRELMHLERDTSPGFLARVRRRIYRRSAVSHVATFSWHLPRVILIELVSMLGHILNAIGTRKGSER